VVEPFADGGVVATLIVVETIWIADHRAGGGDAGLQQLGKLIDMFRISPIGPEHAVGRLVADLHHLRCGSLLLERVRTLDV